MKKNTSPPNRQELARYDQKVASCHNIRQMNSIA
jgi:hypothetical protein